ncbi:2-oxo-4-hydroxy-4-carboxy-5-ureidoimidazoline decarboxylase [Kribbella qitaiheensis]|uniref:2-oxo-4-hydroxy-4-carboxy-5-ureidoimidazoline decarboxylase n=1 Tax=Kribbella qitaiheensis TaxID=1544730 RepID=A0A7G6WS36_9ACTN|nr:2-oxo-4-hydroxy-4-carboxy-5-ureidoimidazoline decarboxylase [Kribbella qitaiheensis]QNE16801.1 2-oxo-4-hydroxy-4-carboxy-5-ureidoimidazoline decarboxylase [Kribbella qitaiheensis]
MDLQNFNSIPADELRPLLAACCDVPRWVNRILTARPYDDLPSLTAVADQAARDLDATEVTQALAAHPRIGDRANGNTTEATWSRNEQSGVGDDPSVRAALTAGNQAYEQRFNQVFLICATGLTASEMLTALHHRLTNDPRTEAYVVQDELRKIAVLRLTKLIALGKEIPA